MTIAVLIRGLDLFRLFDIIWALTGGPGTMTETSRSTLTSRVSGSSRRATRRRSPSLSSCCSRSSSWPGMRRMGMVDDDGVSVGLRVRDGARYVYRAISRPSSLTVIFLFPVYWLFMISFKTPDEIFAFSAGLVSRRASSSPIIAVLFKDGDAKTVRQQPVLAGCQHLLRHDPRHHLRLLPGALQDRRRKSRGVDHLAAHDAAGRHRIPGLSPLCLARLGRYLSSGSSSSTPRSTCPT